jgi:hypothetical protein
MKEVTSVSYHMYSARVLHGRAGQFLVLTGITN